MTTSWLVGVPVFSCDAAKELFDTRYRSCHGNADETSSLSQQRFDRPFERTDLEMAKILLGLRIKSFTCVCKR